MSNIIPKIVVEKHKDYRTIVVDGVFGGHKPGTFEVIVYTDELEPDEALAAIPTARDKIKVRRTIQCRLVLNPVQAKTLERWLATQIQAYEKKFGKIPFPAEKEQAGGAPAPYT